MAPIVLKFRYGKEVRRLTVEQPLAYEVVIQLVRQLFPDLPNFTLKYEDPEGDKITVTTQREIQEAVEVGVNNNKVLVFFVQEQEKTSSHKPETVTVNPVPIPSPSSSSSSSISTTTTTTTPSNNTPPAIHFGITCDGCQASPIVGIRYKCTVCHDFDLCEKCEATKTHDQSHPLIQIAQPNTQRGTRGYGGYWRHRGFGGFGGRFGSSDPNNANSDNNNPQPHHPWLGCSGFWGWRQHMHDSKYKAAFTQNITIEWGASLKPNEPFVKVWKMKNEGDVAWPEETGLSFVDGKLMGAPILVPLYRAVNPGEEIDISVNMIAPSESGKHCSTWRLMSSDGKFGQKLWVAIVVDENKDSEKEEKKVTFSEPVSEVIPDSEQATKVEVQTVATPVKVQEPSCSAPVQNAPTSVSTPVTTASNPSSPVQNVVAPVPNPAPTQNSPIKNSAGAALDMIDIFDEAPVMTELEAQSIATLKDLGFGGDLLSVLRRKKGDIMQVVEELLE